MHLGIKIMRLYFTLPFTFLLLFVIGCTHTEVKNRSTKKKNNLASVAPINYDSCKKQYIHIKQKNMTKWKTKNFKHNQLSNSLKNHR